MAGRMPESKYSLKRLNAAEKQRRAVELRMAGRTWKEIGDTLGYADHSGAIRAVQDSLKKTLGVPSAEFRELTLERLTRILAVQWPDMLRGEVAAAKICLQAIGDMRQLMGVDMPARVEHSGPEGNPIQHEVVTLELGDVTAALATLRDAGAIRMEPNGHAPIALDDIYPASSDA